jgi:hypothetical protein
MSAKKNDYGQSGSKKLNPNLIVKGIVLVLVISILVYSGRHSKIEIIKTISIETNIPTSNGDSSGSKK